MPRLSKLGAAALAAFGWTSGGGVTTVTASYLQVAGGGGGAIDGGGGAGGYLTGTTSLTLTTSYTVTVGAGGTGSSYTPTNGSNSQFNTLTASVGGGKGGTDGSNNAGSGGSGGGAAAFGGTSSGGTGTAGQGNNGGSNGGVTGPYWPAGGGGGAGAVGANGSTSSGGAGGAGTASSISGTSVTYAGGGGGASGGTAAYGAGGSGGGGSAASPSGNPGTANTGGGGGGGPNGGTTGGNGGSGIVIISYAGAQQFGGGVVTSVGGNTIHTFTTSGTLSPINSLSASYLIVAGGGGGANFGGGGGAGGLLTASGLTIDTNSTYLVTVGAGGTGAAGGTPQLPGTSGSNSSFSAYATASVGGGGGGSQGGTALTGGSGGGGAGNVYLTGGSGTSGQGNAGGNGYSGGSPYGAGGGGGASAVGAVGTASVGGNGGAGSASSISGSSVTYAGGGGGSINSGTAGSGGSGGGGNGSVGAATASNGTVNTGGGAGGASNTGAGGSGGSGIVIISYAGSTQQMAGGSVTITGGNVIHTFTSSGYLTPLTYVNNSLRFRASNSAYLSRTPTVASNRTVWTWSGWVKRGNLSTYQALFDVYIDTSNASVLDFNDTNNLRLNNLVGGAAVTNKITSAVYRDPAAWYHVVVSSNGATALNLYVNGVQVTSWGTNTGPDASNWFFNSTNAHWIGREQYSTTNYYADNYLTNVQFIDGQALTPNSFGTFNSYGVWQPINYGGSYGTNGFYLPFNSGSQTYAASFNGSNQYLNVSGTNAGLAFGTSNFTIEYWLYTTTNTTGSPYDQRPSATQGYYPCFYFSSGLLYVFINSANVLQSATFPTNQWVHIALVKNSGTTTLYINGIASGSFADSNTYVNGTNRPTIGGSGNTLGSAIVSGAMSNVRVVNGTAVYTSNFTPSSTPLTAITNTALLTLQNATIIDNSTNAYTITNTGSVTTATGKPLSTTIFQDQSPQGNNWTPTNISGATGSTLDYMTDVPTLTSTTAANYAVLNPLAATSGNVTIVDGNLKVTIGVAGQWRTIVTTMAIPASTGKWYWEATVVSGVGSGNGMVGIIKTTQSFSGNYYLGSDANGYSYQSDANKLNNAVSTAYGTSWTTADVIGIAFDATAGTLTFYKNNTSQGTAFTATTGVEYFPAFGGATNIPVYTINFGQQPFTYTPPSGYVALNTYNL